MISSNGRSTVTPVRMEPVAVQVRRLISDKRYCKEQNREVRETERDRGREEEREKERKRETSTTQSRYTTVCSRASLLRRIEILQNCTRKGKMPDFPCAIVTTPPLTCHLISIG
jgi:hypothetical protein